MKTRSVYDPDTGLFTGEVLTCSDDQIKPNARGALLEGRFDRLSQRVDLATKAVVDYQPTAPDENHEWRENVVNGRPRWVKRSEVVEREERDRSARGEIKRLELRQLRVMRELLIDPENSTARAMLQEIEAKIVEQRSGLT